MVAGFAGNGAGWSDCGGSHDDPIASLRPGNGGRGQSVGGLLSAPESGRQHHPGDGSAPRHGKRTSGGQHFYRFTLGLYLHVRPLESSPREGDRSDRANRGSQSRSASPTGHGVFQDSAGHGHTCDRSSGRHPDGLRDLIRAGRRPGSGSAPAPGTSLGTAGSSLRSWRPLRLKILTAKFAKTPRRTQRKPSKQEVATPLAPGKKLRAATSESIVTVSESAMRHLLNWALS